MKLYDFRCNACEKVFEELLDDVADARCPACHASDVTKQLSPFSVGGKSGPASPPPGCPSGGCCGGGMCGMN